MDTYATLNDALVKLFRDVMDLEEQAISLVGVDIYQKMVKGYNEKQW